MKTILSILLIVSSFVVTGQNTKVAIEMTEYHFLYRGYPNIIKPVVSNCDQSNILILCPNAIITKQEDSTYEVFSNSYDKTLKIYVINNSINEFDTLATYNYQLLNMPIPSLYWGACAQGGKASLSEERIFAKYDASIPLNANFQVLEWTLTHKKKSISGEGNKITKAQSYLWKLKGIQDIEIKALVIGPDGKKHTITGKWIIDVPKTAKNISTENHQNCG